MRAVLLLAMLLLAGCAASPPEEPPALRLLALDGRWPFDPALGEALLAEAGAPAPVGRLVFVEAAGSRALADVAGLDAGAARALGVPEPVRGVARVSAAWAAREGAQANATLALTAYAFPTPYVATFFEMERTPACERRPDAKLCFLPQEAQGEARLRLRVDEGARDAAFLPDLVELGPHARPAWWNGSFESPAGERAPFSAFAGLDGTLTAAEFADEMAQGEWTVRFTLEANGTLAAAGAAGIVRVREPGYLWFDDRLAEVQDPRDQARTVLADATSARVDLRVEVADALPSGIDIILALDDARDLARTPDVTALLVALTPAQERAVAGAAGPDGVTLALRPRALPTGASAPSPTRTLVLAAPPDLDPASLPAVPGARTPALALAGRPGIGEPLEANGTRLGDAALLLAHAAGEPVFTLPAGGRWSLVEHALENLSRSRTLALGSQDLVPTPTATLRIETGGGNATRSIVAIGGVEEGPSATLWTSAALVAGVGRPVAPRLLVPLDAGADADEVAGRVLAAWGERGVVLAR